MSLSFPQTIRCPDCSGTGRMVVDGQTLLTATRPCGTCSCKGRIEVHRWGSKSNERTHLVIAATSRCLCGHRIPQDRRALPGSPDCQDCLTAFYPLRPTARERNDWYLNIRDLP